ncbi:MAG: hypothetical protein HN341_13160 [Verrucomicrobia bacterium]|nr:hypothetical protein [Verrucomicrobiota bacterium]
MKLHVGVGNGCGVCHAEEQWTPQNEKTETMRFKQTGWMVQVAVIAVMVYVPVAGEAANTYFQVNSGNWTNPVNWTGGVPTAGNNAMIGRSDSGGVTPATCVVDTASQVCPALYLASGAATDRGVLNITAGDLTCSSAAYIGFKGTGIVNQSSGYWDCQSTIRIGEVAGSDGTITLSGSGVLTNRNVLYVGLLGNGTFNLNDSAALIRTAGTSYVPNSSGATGVVDQTGGLWDNGNQELRIGPVAGAVGTVNLSGSGVLTNCGALYVGLAGSGTINLSDSAVFHRMGGHAYVPNGGPSATGVVNQTGGLWDNGGGNIRIASASGVGSYSISGGALTNVNTLYNPVNGVGTFSVAGSSASIHMASYQELQTTSTLRVAPDSGGLSPINVSGSVSLKGTLEVDFSNYGSKTDDFTIINYGTTLSGTLFTNILTEGWSADIDYGDGSDDSVSLVNIVAPVLAGTVVTIR